MFPRKSVLLLSLAVACVTACTFLTPNSQVHVQVKWAKSPLKTSHSAVAQMDCYFVNVTGPGVVQSLGNDAALDPTDCLALGTLTNAVTFSSLQSGVSIDIPAGPTRKIQILG